MTRAIPTAGLRGLLALFVAGFALGCGEGPAQTDAGPRIDRETFIATYVDLRAAAIRAGTTSAPEADRARILQAHRVTGEQLLAFAAAHGRDVDTMRQIWNEVERRLDAMHLEGDTASQS